MLKIIIGGLVAQDERSYFSYNMQMICLFSCLRNSENVGHLLTFWAEIEQNRKFGKLAIGKFCLLRTDLQILKMHG